MSETLEATIARLRVRRANSLAWLQSAGHAYFVGGGRIHPEVAAHSSIVAECDHQIATLEKQLVGAT
jgi:hypothetical protein